MKKLLLLTLVFLSYGLNAQQWVSTQAANKKVVLEEFTGIHCGYCPDGHKKASDLKKAYPDDVYLINIHAGGYAVPGAGELDLRTTEGDAIDNAAGVGGYPAGSVNRFDVPWASNRSAWQGKAVSRMGESSPVNVFVKATVDNDTRELTTIVEVYYTGNSTSPSNKLTVALTQDNILGTQSDYGNYNPSNWVNGQYKHNHVLRQHITPGSFGISLDTTTQGKYYYKEFKTILPEQIKDIPVNLYNLHVVAFVTEDVANIYSAHGTDVETSDADAIVDLGITDLTNFPSSICSDNINPKIKVTNNSDKDITNFNVYAVMNGTAYRKSFANTAAPLKAGESTTIDWGKIYFKSNGSIVVSYVGFDGIIGGDKGESLKDVKVTENNLISVGRSSLIKNSAKEISEGFDNNSLTNVTIDNSLNKGIEIATTQSSSNGLGADNTKYALRFSLHKSWNLEGVPGYILMGGLDLEKAENTDFNFSYAYSDGSEGGTAPQIVISYSEDCGDNWEELKTITCSQTGQPANTTSFYIPVSSEYNKETVDISSLVGKSVLLRMAIIPGTSGNALYVDQIELKNSGAFSGVNPSDSFFYKVTDVADQPTTSADISTGFNFAIDSVYTWKVNTVEMPDGWEFFQICDNTNCVDYVNVQEGDFTAKGIFEEDIMKLTIKHNNKVGYGYVMLDLGLKSANNVNPNTFKFALYTTESTDSTGNNSIQILGADEKVLHYFDKTIFVDNEFRGNDLTIYDMNGKLIANQKVEGTVVNIKDYAKGLYIANISRDGEVLKSIKFDNSK